MRLYTYQHGLVTMTIPTGEPLATMTDGLVTITPGGTTSPNEIRIEMPLEEWLRVRNSVEAAIGVAGLTSEQRSLVGYITQEGSYADES